MDTSSVSSEAGTMAVAQSRFARQVRLFPRFLFLPTIIYLLILTIFPLFYSLGVSFFHMVPGQKTRFVGLENYATLLKDPTFHHALLVTLIFVFMGVTVEIVLGVVIALVFNRHLPGLGVFRLIVYIPMMVSPLVMGYFWRFMFETTFGVINYLLSLVGIPAVHWLIEPNPALISILIVDIWQWTPFVVLLMLAGLQTVPTELYEIATLDRASWWMQFRRITLPYLKFPLLLALLFRTIDAIKLFDSIYIMTGGGPGDYTQNLSVMAYKIGFTYFQVGKAAALSWIMVIIVNILATILIQALTSRPGAQANA
ncbi:MAG: sugar ABC transporter permease [Anaerolineae bacterium]|nr:sugar ABC transporter permease [Anaerolineae bacterium]